MLYYDRDIFKQLACSSEKIISFQQKLIFITQEKFSGDF